VPAGTAGNVQAIVCSYHVSQQNTFTGTLTPDMLDAVLRTARGHAGLRN
jgi:uracil-DNA glycosylase